MSFADIASALAHQGGRLLLPVSGASTAGTGPGGPSGSSRSSDPLGPSGEPPPTRPTTVTADDGVELHVEIQDAPGSPLTVVFCHGYLLNSTSWDVQRT